MRACRSFSTITTLPITGQTPPRVWMPCIGPPLTERQTTVRKFGLRICTKQWDLGYNELLIKLMFPHSESRRLAISYCALCIQLYITLFPSPVCFCTLSICRNMYGHTFSQPFARTNSFLTTLHSLPSNITHALRVSTFKAHHSSKLATYCNLGAFF